LQNQISDGKMLKQYLLHEKLPVRFGALLLVVMLIFLAAWTVGYFWLPEGVLRGQTVAHALAGNDLAGGSLLLEWLRLFAINLGVLLVIIVAPNVMRTERDLPFGYATVSLLAAQAGIILGTDSFAIPMGGKMPPSLAIFGSSGLYEIAAYVLAAAATISIARWRLVGRWPRQTVERPDIPRSPAVLRERNLGLLTAVVALAAACAWEAYHIASIVALHP
jgi:hypothetical protein